MHFQAAFPLFESICSSSICNKLSSFPGQQLSILRKLWACESSIAGSGWWGVVSGTQEREFCPQVGQTFIGGAPLPPLRETMAFCTSLRREQTVLGSPQATLKFDESLQGLKELQNLLH